jgi:hypothetical protein
VSVVIVGCAGAVVGPEVVGKESVQSNGVQMNGVQMNGVQMNGVQMNGVQMNGVQMNGVQMNGVAVDGLALQGSWLTGTIIDTNSSCAHSQRTTGAALAGCSPCAQVVAAKDPHCATQTWDQSCVDEAASLCAVDATLLVGATFHANTSDGGTRLLRLDAVQLANDPAPVWQQIGPIHIDVNADVYLYSLSYWQPPPARRDLRQRGQWLPICPQNDRDGLYNTAIPVAGQWLDWPACQGQPGCGGKVSNDGFTLACNDVGAIAKCVQRFQYKPWRSVYETWGNASHYQTLETFHEACVRMVRGDYCGDGRPNTVDGTPIDVYDHLGVQTQTPALGGNFQFEAGWTPGGAACISTTRYQSMGGSMSAPGSPTAIANCPQVAPVQWRNGKAFIVEGCGNAWNMDPKASQSLPGGTNDWPRLWYLISDDASMPGIY